ncbi:MULTISPECIES: hypothetical protein [Bacillus subtilis group]|uniref:hypothetical protein n=1 Tax=Bacillus subtilis group TaxID=653685 RepID=UPI0021D911E7|nr:MULTISPECIES: hypothetical protein [Bacillus subtilis group]MCY9308741.1 hypothetical protein [Bacillus inaquosorum]
MERCCIATIIGLIIVTFVVGRWSYKRGYEKGYLSATKDCHDSLKERFGRIWGKY